jgi:hypothetical protein
MHIEFVESLDKKELAKWAVGAILAASLIATFFYLAPGISENPVPASGSSTSGLNNSVSWAGIITFEFVGSNSTEATAAAGSTVQGAITIDILQAAPLRFYIDDRGYNTSVSTLPAGISISLNVYGNTYYPPLLSSAEYQPPLIPTALGETAVQYEITVAKSVSTGVYDIRILCLSFFNNGTLTDQGMEYLVTLHVQ